MSTLTMPRPSTKPAHNFNPVVHHYYKESDYAWSLHSGQPVTALCGDTGRVSASATGQRSNGALVVCPLCSMTYENLPRARKK